MSDISIEQRLRSFFKINSVFSTMDVIRFVQNALSTHIPYDHVETMLWSASKWGLIQPLLLATDQEDDAVTNDFKLEDSDVRTGQKWRSFIAESEEAGEQGHHNPEKTNITISTPNVRKWRGVRESQKQFREDLLELCGRQCQISGCDLEGTLEAAHVKPFADRGPCIAHENGLLLRGDLHSLFDLHLLTINPRSKEIRFSDVVKESRYFAQLGYRCFAGRVLRPFSTGKRAYPKDEYFEYRYQVASGLSLIQDENK